MAFETSLPELDDLIWQSCTDALIMLTFQGLISVQDATIMHYALTGHSFLCLVSAWFLQALDKLTSKQTSLGNKRLARKFSRRWHIYCMLEGLWDSLIGNVCMCLWLAMMEVCLPKMNTLTRKVLAAERRAATFGFQDEMPGRWVSADSISQEWVSLSKLPSSLPLSGFARLAAILSSSICGSSYEAQLNGKVLTFLTLVCLLHFLFSKREFWIPHVHHFDYNLCQVFIMLISRNFMSTSIVVQFFTWSNVCDVESSWQSFDSRWCWAIYTFSIAEEGWGAPLHTELWQCLGFFPTLWPNVANSHLPHHQLSIFQW